LSPVYLAIFELKQNKTEYNGKSQKMSTDKEQRKIVIKLFSDYCKKNSWGKVYATSELSKYLYPEEKKADQEAREVFIAKWQGTVEAVINKPSVTTLSKPNLTKLFDFIDSYIFFNDEDNYKNTIHEPAFDAFSHFYSSLMRSDPLLPIDNNYFVNRNYIIESSYSKKKAIIGNNIYPKLIDLLSLKRYKNNIYGCIHVCMSKSDYRCSNNYKIMKGFMALQIESSSPSLIGIVRDEDSNKIMTINVYEDSEEESLIDKSLNNIKASEYDMLAFIHGSNGSFPIHSRSAYSSSFGSKVITGSLTNVSERDTHYFLDGLWDF